MGTTLRLATVGSTAPSRPWQESPQCGTCIVTNISLSNFTRSVTYDKGKGEVFVGNGSNLSVVSDTTYRTVRTIVLPESPLATTYDSGKGEVLVGYSSSRNISVVSDSNDSVVANVTISENPYTEVDSLAYDSGKGEVFVGFFSPTPNGWSYGLAVVSDQTNKVVATISVESEVSLVYDPAKGLVFATQPSEDNIAVISDVSNQILMTIPVHAWDGVYDPPKGELFFEGGQGIEVLNDTSSRVVANVTLQFGMVGPNGLTYDEGSGQVAVEILGGQRCYGSISFINDTTNTVASAIAPGNGPNGGDLIFDVGKQELFVGGRCPGSLAVIHTVPTSPQPSLESVSVSPRSIVMQLRGSATVWWSISCVGGPCPVTPYSENVNDNFSKDLGFTQNWGNTSVTLIAGGQADSSTGSTTLYLSVELDGLTVSSSPINITVMSSSSPKGNWFLGLPSSEGYTLIGAIMGVVAVVVTIAILWKRKKGEKEKEAKASLDDPPRVSPLTAYSPPVGPPPE